MPHQCFTSRGIRRVPFYHIILWIGYVLTRFLVRQVFAIETSGDLSMMGKFLGCERSEELITNSVFNFSSIGLSKEELEVLSRGPSFGIPPGRACKKSIQVEFELFYCQLECNLPPKSDKTDDIKAKLADLVYDNTNIKQDKKDFLWEESIQKLFINFGIEMTLP